MIDYSTGTEIGCLVCGPLHQDGKTHACDCHGRPQCPVCDGTTLALDEDGRETACDECGTRGWK